MNQPIRIQLSDELKVLALQFGRVCEEIVRTGGKQPPRFKNAETTVLRVLNSNAITFEEGANLLDAIGGYVVACKQSVENHGEKPIVFESAVEFMELAEAIQGQMQAAWGTQKPGKA
jgi:hypothetical protein